MTVARFFKTNVLYCGDNLDQLPRFLPDESIDLIYLDPPFFSNRTYEVIWGDEAEVRSFEDRWEAGLDGYLDWMEHRLAEMHRVLKPTGSIYLHCDHHASDYLKVMLDEIFGLNNLVGKVAWRRTSAHVTTRRWPRLWDTILHFAKDAPSVVFNPPKIVPDEGWVTREYRHEDERGRYMLDNLTGAGLRGGPSGQPWRGVDPAQVGAGRHWRYVPETLDRLDAEGRIYWPKRGKYPKLKQYLSESGGTSVGDFWSDISVIGRTDRERLGYPTQKPLALLERIIQASSNPGDVVLDPFCGCGTTVAAAHLLSRQWIGVDISPTAVNVMKRRLEKLGAAPGEPVGLPTTVEELRRLKPFEFQNWVIQRFHGTHSKRKSKDMGIDGYSFFVRDPIQVKRSERVGRPVVDGFETAVERANKDKGYIVAFSFTRDARQEVKRVKRAKGLEIELVRVVDLLERPAAVVHPLPGQLVAEEPSLIPEEPSLESPPKEALPSGSKLVQSDRKSGRVA